MIQGPRKWIYIGGGGLVLIMGLWMILSPGDSGISDPELAKVVEAGNKKKVDQLQTFAKNSRANVASEALTQLVRVQGKDARPAVEAAMGDSRREVKLHAVTLMGKVGDPDDPSQLVALLADADPAMKSAACAGLGQLRAVDSLEALFNLAERDSDAQVQAAAIDAAQRIMGIRFKFTPGADPAQRRKELVHPRDEIKNTRKLYGKKPR